MAIFLVDYENVYIDGLYGIENLTAQDAVHIFYTQNRCGLTFSLYQQLISCQADVHLNEVAMSLKNGDPVKNALDIQLMMFTGYLIGTKQSKEIYIISKDKDFMLGLTFYQKYISDENIHLKIIACIQDTFRSSESESESEQAAYDNFVQSLREQMQQDTLSPELLSMLSAEEMKNSSAVSKSHEILHSLLGKDTEEATISRICDMIAVSNTLVEFNNALAKYYRDGQKARVIYHKCKPKFEELRRLRK